jgi:hypothetical protein
MWGAPTELSGCNIRGCAYVDPAGLQKLHRKGAETQQSHGFAPTTQMPKSVIAFTGKLN